MKKKPLYLVKLLTLFLLSGVIFQSQSQDWNQIIKKTAKEGAEGFGYSVSISGNSAIVGYPLEGDKGIYSGSAYIFEFKNDRWVEVTKLTAKDGAEYDQFGYSVSISGNRAIVGAPYDDGIGNWTGSAYVFEFKNGEWVEEVKLRAKPGALEAVFGYSVSISGNRAIVGAPGDTGIWTYLGSTYVFELKNDKWIEVAKLLAKSGAKHDEFGYSVSISGDRVVVGAKGDDDNGDSSGSAYIFELRNGVWIEVVKLLAKDGAFLDRFGYSVSISGDKAIVGAWRDGDNGEDSGSAYVFELKNGKWIQVAKLLAKDGDERESFGYSVSISGDKAIVGAYRDDDKGIRSGSAYIYELKSGAWTQIVKLLAKDGDADDEFGYSVSISEDKAIIGARWDKGKWDNSGSVYFFGKQDPLSTFANESKEIVSLFPNPSKNTITINGVSKNATYIIRTITGVAVNKGIGSEINIQYLQAGVYFVVIEGKVMRFVKR